MPVIVPGIKMTRSWWRVYGALKGAGGGDGGLKGSNLLKWMTEADEVRVTDSYTEEQGA